MAINSHTQLPEQILRHFRDPKSGQIWYLNLKDGKIHKTSSGKLGTAADYYSTEMERYLSETIESPLGAFWTEIKDFAVGKTESVTVYTAKEVAEKNYVIALIARSGYMFEKFEQESFTSALCSPQDNHDNWVWFLLNKNLNNANPVNQLQLAHLVNDTQQYFVVPKNGFYCMKSKGGDCIIVPVSPNYAFILKSAEDMEPDENGESVHTYYVKNEDDIYDFNLLALQFEYAFNKEFVAGSRKDELTPLISFLEEHREELENQRNALFT